MSALIEEDWVWIINDLQDTVWVYGRSPEWGLSFYSALARHPELDIAWNYEGEPDILRRHASGDPYRRVTRSELAALIAMARAREAMEGV